MMMAELIDRKQMKADVKSLLAGAQVSPKGMVALYLGLSLVLSMVTSLSGGATLPAVPEGLLSGLLSTFLSILIDLLSIVLSAGFVLYCMAVRRGERAEYLTLFDGFSFVGKLIGLHIVMGFFIMLWSMLFLFPGIVASYRYRFALYDLYENPGIGIMEALEMSKRQTLGYKSQLFLLDLSYLGWSILASIPVGVYSGILSRNMMDAVTAYPGSVLDVYAAVDTVLPAWGWTLVFGLWSLLVGLFYYANYQCVELGYFETAKRTSGVGEGAAPRQDSTWNGGPGPDGLGGF